MSFFKRNSFCGRVVALAMGALLTVSSPAQALAEAEAANAGKYVSDVRVGVGKTDEEAVASLENEGYTVMGYLNGKEREDAEGRYAKLADLNEGTGAWFKSTRKVFLGYKTTDNQAEAITDLAVMGMNGGYSFSSYAQLMDKYREQTVGPLQDNVMRMVAEYRSNYESDDPGRKGRAEIAKTSLNMVIDDDSGERMGDLLLKETSQEMGATPSTMEEAEARAWREANPGVLDLECALMQGNAGVVSKIEILLASATDDTDTTWLERLSELGPDGLEERFADMAPTDARREMDSLYQDTAMKLAEGWGDFASMLDEADRRIGSEYEDAVGDNGDSEDGEANEDAGDTDNPDEPVEVEGDDEIAPTDLSDFLTFDVEEPEETLDLDNLTEDDFEELVSDMTDCEQTALEAVEDTQETAADTVYRTLRELPFGDGTLYDYFSMGESEAVRDGAYALYPIVSVLTDGQLASVNFQSLISLVQQGATINAACEAITGPDSNLLETVEKVGDVSLYQDVRREIFSDLSALTSEAMRKDVLKTEGASQDLLGSLRLAKFFSIATLASGIATYASYHISAFRNATENLDGYTKTHQAFTDAVTKYATITPDRNYDPATGVLDISNEGLFVKKVQMKGVEYFKVTPKSNRGQSFYFSSKTGINENMTRYQYVDRALKRSEDAYRYVVNIKRYVQNTLKVATVILLLITIISTVYEVYSYYNVDYTPIPKYMVDERDLTQVADDGTTVVTRNDAAYYEVARTNRSADADHYEALRDFADLNGDRGKGWLALYVGRDTTLQPILADSLAAVTGTTTVPGDYVTGIHEFGSEGAANLTDEHYSYNDDAGGIYTYFAREEPELPNTDTASIFSHAGGTGASPLLFATLGLTAGAAAGSAITYAVLRRRKEQ